MKICIVTGEFPIKTQTFVVRQAIELNADVITTKINHLDKNRFNLEGIKINEIKDRFKFFKKKWRNACQKIFKTQSFLWSKNALNQAQTILNDNNYDFVLGVFGEHGLATSIVCKRLKMPYAIQFLGVDASKFLLNKSYVRNIIVAVNESSFSIALSNDMKYMLENIGISKEKLVVHNIGVPINKFEQIKLKEKHFCKFVAMGRMVEKKAPLNSIQAFEICADNNPNVSFEFVGDGILYNDIQNYVAGSRHKNKIKLHGYVNNQNFKDIVNFCHVFIQHSVTSKDGDKEGWPVAIAEACCYGLPIVSTRHSGIKEQVVNGYNGYLVDEHNIEGMAKYMTELSFDFKKCVELGNNSRLLIEKNGDLKKQIEILNQMIIQHLN